MDLQRKTDFVAEAKTIVTILQRWAKSGDECTTVMTSGLTLLEGVLQEAIADKQPN
jgi:hypothetical protein